MADWDTLVTDEGSLDSWPEPALARLIKVMSARFGKDGLKVWDLGCGRGRHSLALAAQGIDVYSSDYSQNAIDTTAHALEQKGLTATLRNSKIDVFPFDETLLFNGIVCWNVLQHACLKEAGRTVKLISDHLISGGYALLSLCSTRSPGYGRGECIEEGSYVSDGGREKGVLHHYFSKEELEELFSEDEWRFAVLAENLVLYYDLDENYADPNVFRSTGWLVIAERK